MRLLFCVLLFFKIYCYGQINPSAIAVEILSTSLYTNELNQTIDSTLVHMLDKTQFKNKYILNGPRRNGFIAIYIIKENIKMSTLKNQDLINLIGTCAFIGDSTIIVDSGFLKNYVASKKVYDGYPGIGERMREANFYFLTWVIGHEIGHLILNHLPSHFEPNQFERDVPSSNIGQKQELAADSFLVANLNTSSLYYLISFLESFLNAEIKRKVGDVPYGAGILFDYTNEKVVKYFSKGTHPEFVVRTTRMLLILADRVDHSGLKMYVSKFASHMKKFD